MNSNWVCHRFHLDIKCFFFVFGIFLHPREGKKKASAKQDLLGGEMVYCCHIMKDF
jgi:hypothetical protein